MPRYLFLVCLVVLGWLQSAQALEVMRPKLACFPLAARTIEAMAYNENISALLVNALNRSGAAELIERKKIEGVIEQHGLRLDAPDQAILKGLGSEAGFNFILTGSVGRDQGKLVLDLNLLAAHSPEENHHWNYRMGDGEVAAKVDEITAAIIPILRSFDKVLPAPQPGPAAELAPPGDLHVSGTQRSIKLKWSHSTPSAVSVYKIFRSTSPDGAYSQVGNSSIPSFSDDGLELNDSFYYRIKAMGREGGESGLSQAVQGRTTVVPQPPVFMQVESGIGSALLSWYQRPVTGSDALLAPVKYRIYRGALDETEYQQVAEVDSTVTAYTDTQLPGGGGFRYCLTSVNSAGGESEQSTALQVAGSGGLGGVSAESGGIRQVRLSWQPHAAPHLSGYAVYRSAAKEGPFERIGRAEKGATSYLDAVDGDGALRWYRISAVDKEGRESPPSAPVSATTRPIPVAPTGVQAASGQPRRVRISWLPLSNRDDDKGGYCVYRSEEMEGKFKRIAKVDAKVTEYEDASTPLEDNAPYWYRVTALNGAGVEGFASAAVKGVTKPRPAAPQGVAAKSGEVKRVSLSWQQNRESDISEYRIWLRAPSGKYTLVAASKSPSYVDTGLSDGTLFTYAVTAVDSDGLESSISHPVQAATVRAPSRATGTRPLFRDGLAGIAWGKNPESDVKAYLVYRKGFLGAQKLGETTETEYLYHGSEKVELYVTAVNKDGLESEPSAPVIVDAANNR